METYSKTQDLIFTLILPSVMTLIISLLAASGYTNKYGAEIILGGIALGIIITILLISLWFLSKREKRWENLKDKVGIMQNEIIQMKEKIAILAEKLDTERKINKLENQLYVLKGEIRGVRND